MGCTPSKQIDASREDSDSCERESFFVDQSLKNENSNSNGNSKNNTNGSASEKLKSNKSHSASDSKTNKSRPAKAEKKCTQSQLDFFEVLDRKIAAGPDYASEDDRGSRVHSER